MWPIACTPTQGCSCTRPPPLYRCVHSLHHRTSCTRQRAPPCASPEHSIGAATRLRGATAVRDLPAADGRWLVPRGCGDGAMLPAAAVLRAQVTQADQRSRAQTMAAAGAPGASSAGSIDAVRRWCARQRARAADRDGQTGGYPLCFGDNREGACSVPARLLSEQPLQVRAIG